MRVQRLQQREGGGCVGGGVPGIGRVGVGIPDGSVTARSMTASARPGGGGAAVRGPGVPVHGCGGGVRGRGLSESEGWSVGEHAAVDLERGDERLALQERILAHVLRGEGGKQGLVRGMRGEQLALQVRGKLGDLDAVQVFRYRLDARFGLGRQRRLRHGRTNDAPRHDVDGCSTPGRATR